MLDRRAFLAGTLTVLIMPPAAETQSTRKLYRIGFLAPLTAAENSPFLEAFRQGLRELGDVEGQNIALEVRYADGRPERFPELAAELVRLKVDLIVAQNNPGIAAAHRATSTIPIVMGFSTDPVALGFVASLARPGGNITGLSLQYPEYAGKRLQLLKEAVANLTRVAVLRDPAFPGFQDLTKHIERAAGALGLELQFVDARSPSEVDSAFAAMTRQSAGAVLLHGSNMQFIHRALIAGHAVKSRLPTMGNGREYVEAGCLMSYFPSFVDLMRRASIYVDRIIKGATPADLPIEQPTKFELIINMKTAKALGLTMPPSLLLRADQIIE